MNKPKFLNLSSVNHPLQVVSQVLSKDVYSGLFKVLSKVHVMILK